MKQSRSKVRSKTHAMPELRFEEQTLTSFSGLVIFQKFFALIGIKRRFRACFDRGAEVYDRSTLFLQLVFHLLIGYRELRHSRYYQDDPLVQRVLGLGTLPDTATLSRMLKGADEASVAKLRFLLGEMVLERLAKLGIYRVTLDFDGSVQSTRRHAEGTAVGFNKKRKGARSYYPLFGTVAQTGQVLDFLHRSGNVHDSNGAREFILECVDRVRGVLPGLLIEVRMDSAFFSDEIVTALSSRGVEFSISVPFERFAKMKAKIEGRKRWRKVDDDVSFFEEQWKPESWDRCYRFVFVRTKEKQVRKGPIQLDLFIPYEFGYQFKVIITNKTLKAKHVVRFHEGRGSQENVFGELKTSCHIDYIPTRTRRGNQLYLLAGLFAHNLTRELQMHTTQPTRHTTPGRNCLWAFEKLDTLRKTVIQRAGRLTRPGGTLTLTIGGNGWLKDRILGVLNALSVAA